MNNLRRIYISTLQFKRVISIQSYIQLKTLEEMPLGKKKMEFRGTLVSDKIENSMQSSFFNKNVANSPNLRVSDKGTPLLSGLDDEEFSNNVLNIGFIAEDSKFNLSDSCSVASDGFSMSAVSVIQPNPKGSPRFISNIPEEYGTISGMEQWPSPQLPFAKRNFKRCKPQMIEDQLQQLANRCTKRKMENREIILTINPGKGLQQRKSERLRSRSKFMGEEDNSSNEDIREMLRDIEKGEKGANIGKSKLGSK